MSHNPRPNVPRQRMGRQACDRCHDQKLRCTADNSSHGRPCLRCQRLDAICSHASPPQIHKTEESSRRKQAKSLPASWRGSRPVWEGLQATPMPVPAPGEQPPSNVDYSFQWAGMMNTALEGSLRYSFDTGTTEAPLPTPLWFGSTAASQAGSSSTRSDTESADRSEYFLADVPQLDVQTSPTADDDFDIHCQGPIINDQHGFRVELQTHSDKLQEQVEETNPAMHQFALDENYSSKNLLRLSLALEEGRKHIEGNASVEWKSKALIPPCRQFVIALHCLCACRRNVEEVPRPETNWQQQHSPVFAGPNPEGHHSAHSATALLVLSCYTSLLLLLIRFADTLECQSQEPGFPFHSRVPSGGQWSGTATPFPAPTQSELNNAWYAQMVSQMFGRSQESLRTFMRLRMGLPCRNSVSRVGDTAGQNHLPATSPGSYPQRKQRRLMSDSIQLALTELAEEEGHLREVINRLQS